MLKKNQIQQQIYNIAQKTLGGYVGILVPENKKDFQKQITTAINSQLSQHFNILPDKDYFLEVDESGLAQGQLSIKINYPATSPIYLPYTITQDKYNTHNWRPHYEDTCYCFQCNMMSTLYQVNEISPYKRPVYRSNVGDLTCNECLIREIIE